MSAPGKDDGRIEIRSYRVCFDLERRIHKIDRWRVPLPYGVPFRGIGYAAVLLAAVLMLQGLPVFGQVLGALHPALRYLVLPVGLAAVLTGWRVDGRTAHQTALAWLRYHCGRRSFSSFRPLAQRGQAGEWSDVAVASDERTSRLRRAVVEGPSRVLLRYPVQTAARGNELRVAQTGAEPQWRGTQVDLREGQRLVVA